MNGREPHVRRAGAALGWPLGGLAPGWGRAAGWGAEVGSQRLSAQSRGAPRGIAERLPGDGGSLRTGEGAVRSPVPRGKGRRGGPIVS